MFVTAVYSDVGISSLTHCMGFEKLPFCEWYDLELLAKRKVCIWM